MLEQGNEQSHSYQVWRQGNLLKRLLILCLHFAVLVSQGSPILCVERQQSFNIDRNARYSLHNLQSVGSL